MNEENTREEIREYTVGEVRDVTNGELSYVETLVKIVLRNDPNSLEGEFVEATPVFVRYLETIGATSTLSKGRGDRYYVVATWLVRLYQVCSGSSFLRLRNYHPERHDLFLFGAQRGDVDSVFRDALIAALDAGCALTFLAQQAEAK